MVKTETNQWDTFFPRRIIPKNYLRKCISTNTDAENWHESTRDEKVVYNVQRQHFLMRKFWQIQLYFTKIPQKWKIIFFFHRPHVRHLESFCLEIPTASTVHLLKLERYRKAPCARMTHKILKFRYSTFFR